MAEWHSFSDAVVREDSEPLTFKRVDVAIVFLGASSQHPWFESLFETVNLYFNLPINLNRKLVPLRGN